MWDYRLIKRTQKINSAEFVTYGIHETYYDKTGEPNGITERPIEPFGETATQILQCWSAMASAFTKPILDYANECLGKSVEKIINFGQLLVNNMKK